MRSIRKKKSCPKCDQMCYIFRRRPLSSRLVLAVIVVVVVAVVVVVIVRHNHSDNDDNDSDDDKADDEADPSFLACCTR